MMESRRMNMLESCWFRTQFLLHRSSMDPFKISREKLYPVCLYFLPPKTCNFPGRIFSASDQLALKESFAGGHNPVLLPGWVGRQEMGDGRRSLEGCSPWGHEESDATERLHFHFSLSCIGERNSNPLQCSCLENPRDGGSWWAAVYGVTQSQTRLKWLSRKDKEESFLYPLPTYSINLLHYLEAHLFHNCLS